VPFRTDRKKSEACVKSFPQGCVRRTRHKIAKEHTEEASTSMSLSISRGRSFRPFCQVESGKSENFLKEAGEAATSCLSSKCIAASDERRLRNTIGSSTIEL